MSTISSPTAATPPVVVTSGLGGNASVQARWATESGPFTATWLFTSPAGSGRAASLAGRLRRAIQAGAIAPTGDTPRDGNALTRGNALAPDHRMNAVLEGLGF